MPGPIDCPPNVKLRLYNCTCSSAELRLVVPQGCPKEDLRLNYSSASSSVFGRKRLTAKKDASNGRNEDHWKLVAIFATLSEVVRRWSGTTYETELRTPGRRTANNEIIEDHWKVVAMFATAPSRRCRKRSRASWVHIGIWFTEAHEWAIVASMTWKRPRI
jgi:hypothetical protein